VRLWGLVAALCSRIAPRQSEIWIRNHVKAKEIDAITKPAAMKRKVGVLASTTLRATSKAFMNQDRAIGGFLAIALVTLVLAGFILAEAKRRTDVAIATYVSTSAEEARVSLKQIELLFVHLYEDLRTLAALPSVRSVDRHGTSLVGDSRETFQQIYNNLANAVAVSEVYVIPRDFNPDRIDPVTGKPEEPIIMFDELIVDAASKVEEKLKDSLVASAHEEIEIHEYREFAKQAKWMAEHYARRESIKGMDVPLIGSRSLITCDNTYFMHSGRDADRMGILLSVPFYGPDGAFKGLVAAIILDRALAAALPSKNAVLRNAAYGYVMPSDTSAIAESRPFFEAGKLDPQLLFSAAFDLGVPDPMGAWSVWTGRPNSDFQSSAEALSVRTFRQVGLSIVATLAIVAAVIWGQFLRSRNASMKEAYDLENKVRERTEEIARLALTDALTRLPNRTMMQEHLERMGNGPLATEGYAVLCVDLDRLKLINDTLGHRAGDAYLVAMADRMQAAVGALGTVARWGGDEFVITLEGREACEQVDAIADDIRLALSKPIQLNEHTMVPSGSIGIAQAPCDGTVGIDLLTRADRALYRVKATGRGRVMHFDLSLDDSYTDRSQLELDLRWALQKEQFVVHYQPVVDAASGRVVGFEALVRWAHPQRGLLPPGDFIPIAEETGLIIDIGEFVLRAACKAACSWPSGLGVAVNLSPVQVYQQDLPTQVAAILDGSGLAANRLELEVTERVFLSADEGIVERIGRIRSLGVRFALDDFGTGYCSIGYLHKVAFDRIKIDRSFVADLFERKSCLPIIRAVTQLASSLSMQTTAEGVESREQAEVLSAQGITNLQGYFLGEPVPEPAALAIALETEAFPDKPASAPWQRAISPSVSQHDTLATSR
jgi:diguanylate cyclase (GGDEF)-like protein